MAAILRSLFIFSSLLPASSSFPDHHHQSPPLPFPSNSILQKSIKLGEGLLEKPEDVAVDRRSGFLYTATRDGWIKRIPRNGSRWENLHHVDSHALYGLDITAAGDVIVCDSNKGLLKINKNGVQILVSQVNGKSARYANAVSASTNGKLYFSISVNVKNETSTGKLVEFDPSTSKSSILIDHIDFANGVAVSKNQDFVVVCETYKYRCLKYILEGKDAGKSKIFVDKLPGLPDNIHVAPDGSFWIALLLIKPGTKLEFQSKNVRKTPEVDNKALVVNVAADGKIIKGFDDPTGAVMSFVTSALEFEGNLYMGGLRNNYVGKLALPSMY
ncbi:protein STRICTOSIDINE SYNTHASE-LIKE 6-like [Andrographis paniculata]|uniref:protein STRICTOSIDINE SYNTHASE-LIKE 6-like n=1 Tax=Andrographis paniculata TaxID=175694 RepID=UPI0021E8A51D|nr:protein STRICTOSIDINE SYNTHASE-LIKE 6-like [Andrographis paniculata]